METANQKRRKTLLKFCETDRNNFIHSLASLGHTGSRYQLRLNLMDARDKYDEMKQQGTLPVFCRVLENIRSSEYERLKGDISSDPVYSFLVEVRGKLEEIAGEQYERSPDYQAVDTGGQDWDVYLNSKQDFLSSLLSSIESRSGVNHLVCDWSDSAKINTSHRYDYLASLAKLSGDEQSEAIKELVKDFPSYPWDFFSWPGEKL